MLKFFVAFAGVFITTIGLSPIMEKIGLVDVPNTRKRHSGTILLVGGIAMFSTIALAALFFVPPSKEMAYLLAACALLTMTGSLDDRFNLHYQVRLIIQGVSTVLLIWGSKTTLISFGNLLGFGDIQLFWLSIPITFIAIIGMINAFNMIDGMDGLSGGLALIASVALFYLIGDKIADGASSILLLMAGALSAYLIMNLHLLPRLMPKIFMGDAGSMLLGFIIAAFLIRYSQGSKQIIMPVTALWLVTVPLMDMVATCMRRIRRGNAPFFPDRTHVHHIFIRAGFSPRTVLLIILVFQLIAAGIGIILEKNSVPSQISFGLFILLFIIYLQFIKHAFKTAKWLKRKSTPTHSKGTSD